MFQLNKVIQYFEYLRLDKRSLSLFRIILGISILYNILFIKWGFIKALLGSNPIMPLDELKALSNAPAFSIFDFLVSDCFIEIYMILYIVNTIFFIIGFKTKITSILSVFFQFNLFQATNPIVLGFDMYMFQISFWAMLLPLNSHFSLDKFFLKDNLKTSNPSLIVSVILLFQISCIYFFTGIFKYGNAWIEGYAVRNMLLDENATYGLANFLRQHYSIYSSLTYLTLLLEYVLVILLFIKFKNNLFRIIASLSLLLFHIFIASCYDVGNFSISGIAVSMLILPSYIWKNFSNKIKTIEYKKINIKYIQLFKIFAFAFVVFVILERNIYNYYFYRGDKTAIQKLAVIHLPSPMVASFFTQYWRMFSPEPQNNIGNFEVCKTVESLSNQNKMIVTCDIKYKSYEKKYNTKWERYIISFAKNNLKTKNEDNTLFVFFSKWIVWKLEQHEGNNLVLDKYILMEHRKLCGNQKIPHKPIQSEHYYYIKDIKDFKIRQIN